MWAESATVIVITAPFCTSRQYVGRKAESLVLGINCFLTLVKESNKPSNVRLYFFDFFVCLVVNGGILLNKYSPNKFLLSLKTFTANLVALEAISGVMSLHLSSCDGKGLRNL